LTLGLLAGAVVLIAAGAFAIYRWLARRAH
jgi:hypothetical protein